MPFPASAARAAVEMGKEEKLEQWNCIKPPRRGVLPFWSVVTCCVFITVCLAVGGILIPVDLLLTRLGEHTMESCPVAVQSGNELLAKLVHEQVINVSYMSWLRSVEFNIKRVVMRPSQSAVGSLWRIMKTEHVFENGWTGNRNSTEREQLSRLAWASLVGQGSSGGSASGTGRIANDWRVAGADNVHVGFQDGLRAGVSFNIDRADFCSGTIGGCVDSCWQLSKRFIGHHSANQERQEHEITATLFASARASTTWWIVSSLSGESITEPCVRPDELANMSAQHWYATQVQLKQKGGPLRQAWSKVILHDDHLAISWTAPVAYCGDYSCMQGVISSEMLLQYVSHGAFMLWLDVRNVLKEEPYRVSIQAENSSIFIVAQQVKRSSEQQGLLIGCSHGCPGVPGSAAAPTEERMVHADNASIRAVRLTAQAILARFSSWTNRSLQDNQLFTFKSSSVGEHFELGTYCSRPFNAASQVEDCWQAGTISVRLDEDTSWLVVLVLPASALALKSSKVAEKASLQVQRISLDSEEIVQNARMRSGLMGGIVLVVSVLLAMCLGVYVSRDLKELTVLTQRLSNLDFTAPVGVTGVSCIRDVNTLQSAFCSLTRGIEAFARFVPEPVVRSLVLGEAIKARAREVTILHSDIANFTSISEEISRHRDGHLDLLFLLTRYLSVMHRVVHAYGGMVEEILGDRLRICWGAHGGTEINHPARACAAALEMKSALQLLNFELTQTLQSGTSQPLPALEIRVGIHTDKVLIGIVGSDVKRKVACLGKGAAIVEQLDGVCERLGISTLCSANTYEALCGERYGFVCREVGTIDDEDGEGGRMKIYEVQGRAFPPKDAGGEVATGTDLSRPKDDGCVGATGA